MLELDDAGLWMEKVGEMSEGEFLRWKRGILEGEAMRCGGGEGLRGVVERCMEVKGMEEAFVLCLRGLGELEGGLRGLAWILRGGIGPAEEVFMKTVEVDVVWGHRGGGVPR